MVEKTILESEKKVSKKEAADFLKKMAGRLEKGEISLVQNGNEVNYKLPDEIELEVKVEEESEKGGKEYSLEIEINWPEGKKSQSVQIK